MGPFLLWPFLLNLSECTRFPLPLPHCSVPPLGWFSVQLLSFEHRDLFLWVAWSSRQHSTIQLQSLKLKSPSSAHVDKKHIIFQKGWNKKKMNTLGEFLGNWNHGLSTGCEEIISPPFSHAGWTLPTRPGHKCLFISNGVWVLAVPSTVPEDGDE